MMAQQNMMAPTPFTTPKNQDSQPVLQQECFCVCKQPYVEGMFMVGCELCDAWFHPGCIDVSVELASSPYSLFYCNKCHSSGKYTFEDVEESKKVRKTDRKRARLNYGVFEEFPSTMPKAPSLKTGVDFLQFLHSRGYRHAPFTVFEEPNWETILKWSASGQREPILIKDSLALEIIEPELVINIQTVAEFVGKSSLIEVLNVETQSEVYPQWTVQQWVQYFETPPENRAMTLNVLSLEVSHTPLKFYVHAPQVVRDIDWIQNSWPTQKKQNCLSELNAYFLQNNIDLTKNMKKPMITYPKVQLYCLMSVAGAYTDFHIDFGGSSVWYHIVSGRKIFYLIRPSVKNLRAFEQWTTNPYQNSIFFGDEIEECVWIEVAAGNTFFIPSGWIHAVYTPEDSLVFGGNYLHDLAISKQLEIAGLERRTGVPEKYLFPFFEKSCWYAGARLVVSYYYHKNDLQRLDGIFSPDYFHDLVQIKASLEVIEYSPLFLEQVAKLLNLLRSYWKQCTNVNLRRRKPARIRNISPPKEILQPIALLDALEKLLLV